MTFAEFQKRYQIKLNKQQLDAVQSVEGPILLLAVPGSGKTTVLVTRLGYMIYCKGIAPEKILTLTYTVAATRDMADRFEKFFGSKMRGRLEFRTINGICAKIISYYGRRIGKNSFQLVNDEKSTSGMLSGIFQKVEGTYPTESDIKSVRTWITYIKNMMLSREEILALEEQAGFRLSEIYKCCGEAMRQQNLMDYDDQMIYALNILRRSPETLQYFQQQYPYICVDEAQDTSKVQHAIIAMLASDNENLFMVGDEDQSIYGFRAAYPEALLSFEKNHPGAKVLLMEENFRSNAKIVEAADKFIQKNTMRHEKHMKASRESGTDIKMIALKSRNAQYTCLAKVAADCKEQTAVLYRDNESVLPLVDRLEREGIPYRIRNAELTFFSHRIVQDIENVIRFAMNPKDTDLFMQIYYKLNLYTNKQNAMKYCEISKKYGISVLSAAIGYGNLPGYAVGNLKAMQTHLENMLDESAQKAIYRIVEVMGYRNYLERAGMSDAKIAILKALAAMEEYPAGFLDRMQELEQIIREKRNDSGCPFILSTIHGSKGLEYDNVYLLDVVDGIFPENVPRSQMTAEPKEWEAYEEERRIFYVGITRAKNGLYLLKMPEGSVFYRELMLSVGKKGAGSSQVSVQNDVKAQRNVQVQSGVKTQGNVQVQSRVRAQGNAQVQSGTKAQGNVQKQRGAKVQKDTQAVAKKKKFSEKEYKEFCDSLGEGIAVVHKKYGWGIVAEMSQDYLVVSFQGETKTFLLHVLFENELLKIE